MVCNKKVLAIIPARGGSKRLPRKNVLPLRGKPLIAWTIEEAKKSKFITELVVSTDDKQVSEVSKKYGADVPFIRPDYLAGDKASSIDVVKHALEFYERRQNKKFDYIILLQPTSPLRLVDDIDSAFEKMYDLKADAVVSMCECEHSPLWCNTLPKDDNINNFDINEVDNLRSQDLPQYFRYNGAIYISNVDRLLKEKKFNYKTNSYAYIMPQDRSVDIDTILDFKLAELILQLDV